MLEVVTTHSQAMERSARMMLGVVVERRKSTSRWQDWSWRPVSVILGAPPVGPEWRELLRGETWTQYHAANLPLELHRAETEPYLHNLAQTPPRIYVVLRPLTEPGAHAWRPWLITASPVEAEGYLSSGDEIVEGVPMPESVIAWLKAFVARHHVARPFVKRKRGNAIGPRAGAELGAPRGGGPPSVDHSRGDDGG
jgi:Protein of unknown function (DUF3305)